MYKTSNRPAHRMLFASRDRSDPEISALFGSKPLGNPSQPQGGGTLDQPRWDAAWYSLPGACSSKKSGWPSVRAAWSYQRKNTWMPMYVYTHVYIFVNLYVIYFPLYEYIYVYMCNIYIYYNYICNIRKFIDGPSRLRWKTTRFWAKDKGCALREPSGACPDGQGAPDLTDVDVCVGFWLPSRACYGLLWLATPENMSGRLPHRCGLAS